MAPIYDCRDKSDEELAKLSLELSDYFACLIRRYEEKLRRYLRRLSSWKDEDIDDVLQEVFISAYRHLASFDSSLSFSAWIYRIAHNRLISTWRKNQARPQIDDLDDLAWERIAADMEITEDIDRGLTKDRVAKIISLMKPDQAEILSLKFLEGRSYEEISDIMRKPMGSVASLMHHAKKSFKRLFEDNYQYE